MKNLQAVIDAAFGAPEAVRAPQVPSDSFKQREQALAERAMKIEALRRERLASAQVRPASLVFEIVRHRGHWRTLHGGKHSSPLSDQAAAVLAAKKLARRKRDLGHAVEVILRRTDGECVVQSIDDDECMSRAE